MCSFSGNHAPPHSSLDELVLVRLNFCSTGVLDNLDVVARKCNSIRLVGNNCTASDKKARMELLHNVRHSLLPSDAINTSSIRKRLEPSRALRERSSSSAAWGAVPKTSAARGSRTRKSQEHHCHDHDRHRRRHRRHSHHHHH